MIQIPLNLAALENVGWTGLSFVAGIVVKGAFDSFIRRKEAAERFALDKRVAFLEQQLSRFYWPIYLLLGRDDLMYGLQIEANENPESPESRLSKAIESGAILPSHQAVLKVIEENIHLAGDKQVCDATLRYVNHVKVYEMLAAAGVKSLPISHGYEYPKEYYPLIKDRVTALQAEYDRLIQMFRLDEKEQTMK
jgi:hypothetical protein